jgi:hypothetical protein
MQVNKVVKQDKKSKEEIQEEVGCGKDAAILRLCQAADKKRPTIGLLKDAGGNTVSEADLLRVTFKDVLPEKTRTELLSQMLKDVGESYNLWISALSR